MPMDGRFILALSCGFAASSQLVEVFWIHDDRIVFGGDIDDVKAVGSQYL